MKARKACWTCTARKIRCDGGLPTCKNCCRAQRDCQGYGMRLSWPRDNDRKRAIVQGHVPPAAVSMHLGQVSTELFVNTTWRDMELYRYLSLRAQPSHPVPHSPGPLRQPQLQVSHMDLFHYFRDSAYRSLATFGQDTSQIRDTLMSMALTQENAPGLALFYSLLAFSSLHRYGLHQQAMQLKIAALHHLSASVGDEPLTPTKAIHHVAASMLLGAFEIMLPSESSGEWLWHTRGAMDMIQAAHLVDHLCKSDIGHLLDWVYYHDVLSRFAVQHWRHKSVVPRTSDKKIADPRDLPDMPLARYRPIPPPSPNPSYAILNLLSEICDTLLDPRDPRSHDKEYHDRLRTLERRVETVPIRSTSAKPDAQTVVGTELYQMATRVYLARASQRPWEPPAKLDHILDDALEAVVDVCGGCEHFFPLFILSCEARKEEHRVAMLSLIDRTARDTRIRSVQGVRNTVLAIWVQQDLHEDGDLWVNYTDMMRAVISSSSAVPSFV